MNQTANTTDVHALHSTLRESIVEHLFIGTLLRRLWQARVFDAEILKSEFDAGGYDLVMTWRDITRHIQLKVTREGGRRADVNINLRLAEKPSGCVVWIFVDDALEIVSYRWFGQGAYEALPNVSHLPVVKHTKGTSEGVKNERAAHRLLRKSAFKPVADIDTLLRLLLGDHILPAL